jgi:hypothetical protein
MEDMVLVQIPVTPSVAEALEADPRRRESVGRLVNRIVGVDPPWRNTGEDPLMAFLASLPRDAEAPPLSDAEIDAEIAAYRAEHRP